jgi:hypothetical protein
MIGPITSSIEARSGTIDRFLRDSKNCLNETEIGAEIDFIPDGRTLWMVVSFGER